jgi:hypothetical protein
MRIVAVVFAILQRRGFANVTPGFIFLYLWYWLAFPISDGKAVPTAGFANANEPQSPQQPIRAQFWLTFPSLLFSLSLHWGTTDDEVECVISGDDIVQKPKKPLL